MRLQSPAVGPLWPIHVLFACSLIIAPAKQVAQTLPNRQAQGLLSVVRDASAVDLTTAIATRMASANPPPGQTVRIEGRITSQDVVKPFRLAVSGDDYRFAVYSADGKDREKIEIASGGEAKLMDRTGDTAPATFSNLSAISKILVPAHSLSQEIRGEKTTIRQEPDVFLNGQVLLAIQTVNESNPRIHQSSRHSWLIDPISQRIVAVDFFVPNGNWQAGNRRLRATYTYPSDDPGAYPTLITITGPTNYDSQTYAIEKLYLLSRQDQDFQTF